MQNVLEEGVETGSDFHSSEAKVSDTPRTDAALEHQGSTYDDVVTRCENVIAVSRQLERLCRELERELQTQYVPTPVSERPKPHSWSLLTLIGAELSLYFVMEERYGNPAQDDYENGQRYFYEEHSCPTNWLGDCVAVIEAGDSDPHGFLTFVRTVRIPEDNKPSQENWQAIFPEVFGKPTDSSLLPKEKT